MSVDLNQRIDEIIEALRDIDEWWEIDNEIVRPAKKPNEFYRNDSMAASSIIKAKEAYKKWKELNDKT